MRTTKDRASFGTAESTKHASGTFLARHAGHQFDAGVGGIIGKCTGAQHERRLVVIVKISIGRGAASAWTSVRLDGRSHRARVPVVVDAGTRIPAVVNRGFLEIG